MKIVQQSRQVFTSGIDTAKFNATFLFNLIMISIYTLSDLGVLSNLIGSLSLANEHYSPPTE